MNLNREFRRKCHNFAYNWKITFCRRAFFSNKWKMRQATTQLFQKVFSCCFAAKLCFLRSHLQNLLPRKNSLEYSAEFIIISSRFKIIWLKWPLKRPTENIEIGQIMARMEIFLHFRAFSLYISCSNSTYFC